MSNTPRLLLVEDSEHDALLILAELRRCGFEPLTTRVENAEEFQRALTAATWDLILADYNLPSFSGLEALDIFQRSGRDIPFLLVSGTVGEEVAVTAMRAGANDYVLKDNLTRLGPAVTRELRDCEVRRGRREDHQRLVASERRFTTIFKNSPVAIVITEVDDGTIIDLNAAALVMTGLKRDEIIGRSMVELGAWLDAEEGTELVQAALAAGPGHAIERPIRTPTRGTLTVLASFSLIELDGVSRLLVMMQDITDRKAAEEDRRELEMQLRQAQKMEAIGTLAGGIAHDFNNILTAIFGYVQLAELEIPPTHPARAYLEGIMRGSERARDLVSQIVTFSRRREQQRTIARLGPVVHDALRLLRASLPATIEFRTEIDLETPPVLCDATQLHQIVMNLGANAAYAMRPRGGVLTVSLNEAEPDSAVVASHPQLGRRRPVCLTISDTGMGMDSVTRDRIFEPFFTTKPVGEGSGLGLAVVHGIVQTHEGAIVCASEPGAGTTFRIYFPPVDIDGIEAPLASAELPQGQGERVLLVDDEEAVVAIASRMLERLGYRPTVFSDSRVALEQLLCTPEAFDVVLTDLTMAGVTGVDLAREARGVRPKLPVIITTGFMNARDIDSARVLGVQLFLEKPFVLSALADCMHQALHPPAPVNSRNPFNGSRSPFVNGSRSPLLATR
jgi:PAS domain S-box-containing protein